MGQNADHRPVLYGSFGYFYQEKMNENAANACLKMIEDVEDSQFFLGYKPLTEWDAHPG